MGGKHIAMVHFPSKPNGLPRPCTTRPRCSDRLAIHSPQVCAKRIFGKFSNYPVVARPWVDHGRGSGALVFSQWAFSPMHVRNMALRVLGHVINGWALVVIPRHFRA